MSESIEHAAFAEMDHKRLHRASSAWERRLQQAPTADRDERYRLRPLSDWTEDIGSVNLYEVWTTGRILFVGGHHPDLTGSATHWLPLPDPSKLWIEEKP